jgi:peptidoglycan/xylan/chitin deacetylase (PgdA/CDA1 family)
MYHRTPASAGHPLDAPMPLFRAQIRRLLDAGVRFVPFAEALDPACHGEETVVSVTFDDGHGSNLDAMAHLEDMGVPCASFFISGYVMDPPEGFMDVSALAEASALCEVGAHGVTHTDLTHLDDARLGEELATSKDRLEQLCGRPVVTMTAPGGRIDRRVVRAAVAAGYRVIGDSESLLNTSAGLPVHRHCVTNDQTPDDLLFLARAGRSFWRRRHARRIATRLAGRLLSPGRVALVRRRLGRA